MKKVLSMVLVLCMLLSAAAFAEQAAVLQDELPPEVVPYINAEGENVVAKICDAEGNVLVEIKEDGTLVLTDVSARQVAENDVIVTRLTEAYETVMDQVHHSDVECKLHDHSVKVDVDTVLASLEKELDSHDLVVVELFDVMIPDEAAALLTDGCYLEMTLKFGNEVTHTPLMTLFTGDGFEWMVLPTEASAEGFIVRLPKRGVLALMSDGTECMGIGKAGGIAETIILDTNNVEDGGSNFTPSVTGKTAPTIQTTVGEDGKTIVGYIYSADGTVAVPVPDENYILVTSVAERRYVADLQTFEHLEWGFESLLAVEDVGDLFTEHDLSETLADSEHQTLAAALDATLAELNLDLTHDQLVVKELFEVSAYGDYLHLLYDENNYLEVTFDTTLDPAKPVVVIHSPDSKHWHVHPVSEFEMDENGALTLRMYDMGIVAFLVEADEVLDPETAVQSPD